jgi:intraflagellar transport protein 172
MGCVAGIIDFLEPAQALPYFRRIAGHYEQAGQFEEAEKYWVRASLPLEAVEMYCRAGATTMQ